MIFDTIKEKLRGINPIAQDFWAGTGAGRARGPRLADPKVTGPTPKEMELAVEEGRLIETGGD